MNTIYTIVPAFNEERNLKRFIPKVLNYTEKIIVVNDGSTDKTVDVLKKYPTVKVVNYKNNLGKGAAMRKGAKLAWKLKASGIVFIDADNQHDPKHLPKFYNLLNKNVDIIIGVRILKASVPVYRKLGNKLLLLAIRVLFNLNLEDLLCGFRGYTKKGFNKTKWSSNNYGVETEVITLIGRKKLKFEKIVVDTIYLNKYKGFSIKDGLAILFKLPYWKFRKI